MTISFTRNDLAKLPHKLLRNGHLFNARVISVEADGQKWTVKDFSDRPWYVRVIARVLLNRELRTLNHLKGIDGFAPDAFRIDKNAIAIRFMDGEILSEKIADRVTPAFLQKLEALTHRMHEAGVVHLDIRSLSNVLIREDGSPAIIDFQAAFRTDKMPKIIKRALEDFDMSGAYKKWLKFQPDAMGEFRRSELKRIDHMRRLWIFRGYFGLHHK